MIFRYQNKQILLILSMTLAVKQTKKKNNKQTIFCISCWSQPSMRPERKKATLQGSEHRERENSNQAESFQNQQTEASLFNNNNNKKNPFSCSQIYLLTTQTANGLVS